MYTDDSTIHTSATTANEVTETLNNELQSVLESVASNKLVLNISKTKSIVFGTNHSLRELSVELRDRILSRHRSGERYQKMSAVLKVPKNTVASIIFKWEKFGITKNLP